MKILVADDDAVSRRMMERMLQNCGYEVSSARNGVEAIERLLDPDGPRLVLLDWMMPELDGPEVCRAIRSREGQPYVYITLLTSRESKEDLVAGLEAGADDYLTKPCNIEELRARLRTGERILRLEDSLVEARDQMQFRATFDALTLLLNREAILARLGTELAKSEAEGSVFSIVLCDVDHFKLVNDTYGHAIGDEVLKKVAERLKNCVRRDDGVGRYGGEEFFLVLANCDLKDLEQRSERIREAVGREMIPTAAGPLRVSISAGALRIDEINRGNGPEKLLKDVDEALYRAKREGRNRIVFADPATVIPMPDRTETRLALCS